MEIVAETGTRETTKAYIRLFINGDPQEPWLHHIENEKNPLSAELFIDWLGITPFDNLENPRMKVHAYQINENKGDGIPFIEETTRFRAINGTNPQQWTKYAYSGAINEFREERDPSYLDTDLQYLYESKPNYDCKPLESSVGLYVKFTKFSTQYSQSTFVQSTWSTKEAGPS